MSKAPDRDREAADNAVDTLVEVADLRAEIQRLRVERDALEERVTSSTADLKNLVQVRDEFIATASHDLKAPLTTILAGAQMIERMLAAPVIDAEKAVRWVQIVHHQVRVMTLLINDLLDASRIQTGAFDLRLADCDINACVNTVLNRLEPDLQARVTVSLPPYPVHGQWDRQRVEQVLANLLDNALKYSPFGDNISVAVEHRLLEVQVAVSDRGLGIAPAEVSRVFERFFRTSKATTSAILGTGLGLYICDQIITALGGHIWVDSAGLGEGSTFQFTLPLDPQTGIGADRSDEAAR